MKPEVVAGRKKESIKEAPLRFEEEPVERNEGAEETKNEQGQKSLLGAYRSPPFKAVPAPRPGKPAMEFPLGEHMVVEADGVLSCRKCGRTASLGDADKFAETPCTQPRQQMQKTENKHPCDVCRACEGVEETPILDPITGRIDRKLLCGNCFKDYLRIMRFSGPRFGSAKAKAPPSGVWFSYGGNNSILLQQIGGVWPCPSCQEFFENLYETVIHYSQRHPEITNKQNEKTMVKIDGKPVEVLKTSQGYLICPCGFVAENDRHLARHYINSHKETVQPP